MAARRDTPRYWWGTGYRQGQTHFSSRVFSEDLPLPHVARLELINLGLARRRAGTVELELDVDGLTTFELGRAASERPFPAFTGDDLSPLAAQWLCDQRRAHEPDVVATRWRWCTHCGALYFGRNWKTKPTGPPPECPSCRNVNLRPGLRECAARDCDEWFVPTQDDNLLCGARCKQAEYARRAEVKRRRAA